MQIIVGGVSRSLVLNLADAGSCRGVAGVEVLGASAVGDGTVGLDSLASVATDGECASLLVEVASVLILVVGGDAGRRGTVEFHLYAVLGSTSDVHRSALHQEVLLAVDGVLLGSGDVQRQVLDLQVLLAVDGVLRVAGDVERAFSLQLGVPLAVQAAGPSSGQSIYWTDAR